MVTRMNIYGATDVGRVRTNNEDCYIALVGDECPAGIDALLIVADGMGGHAAGEVASKMAVEGMVDKLVGEEDYLTSLEGAGFGLRGGAVPTQPRDGDNLHCGRYQEQSTLPGPYRGQQSISVS